MSFMERINLPGLILTSTVNSHESWVSMECECKLCEWKLI
jgi:hypothetical protein